MCRSFGDRWNNLHQWVTHFSRESDQPAWGPSLIEHALGISVPGFGYISSELQSSSIIEGQPGIASKHTVNCDC